MKISLAHMNSLHMNAKVGIITDKIMLEHKRPYAFIECPERLEAIMKFISNWKLPYYELFSRKATDNELNECHNLQNILKQVEELSLLKHNYGDNYVVPKKTLNAAYFAAGCSIELVQNIVLKQVDCGFAFVRPPGHHAHASKVGGFCIFNNAMLAANEASKTGKVCIFDFDVHFNDGTYDILKNGNLKYRNNIASVSIHRCDNFEFYPGKCQSGITHEEGNILNVGFDIDHGTKIDDDYYEDVMKKHVIPYITKFQPKIIVVSAGFDAAEGDEIGGCHVTPKCYGNMISQLKIITPHIAMILEGGYNITSTVNSIEACLHALYT